MAADLLRPSTAIAADPIVAVGSIGSLKRPRSGGARGGRMAATAGPKGDPLELLLALSERQLHILAAFVLLSGLTISLCLFQRISSTQLATENKNV